MARYVPIVLFCLVLIAPFAVRRALRQPEQAQASVSTSTTSNDTPQITIVTANNQDIRQTFERAFSDWHQSKYGQSVRVVYLTPGGANDIVRLLVDSYLAYRDPSGNLRPEQQVPAPIDMMWGGGDYPFEVELKPRGILKPINVDPAFFKAAFPAPDIAGVPLYEPVKPGQAPRWVGTAISGFGIVYSPTLYATLNMDPPKTWSDLASPRLNNLVALADPTRSASVAQIYLTAMQRAMADGEEQYLREHPDAHDVDRSLEKHDAYYDAVARGWKNGMGFMLLMAANARYFTDSAPQVPNDVANGYAAVGVAIDFYGRTYEDQLGTNRIKYISPRAATSLNADPIAILYGVKGQQYELCNRFITFLLSPEGQRLWNLKPGFDPHVERSLRRLPIRRDVYADRTGFADDTNPFEESGGFNLRPAWTGKLLSDCRPIWAAAWIDSQTSLKDAYTRILSVPDATRRDALLPQLANLPIEMDDVLRQRATRREMDAQHQDSRQWMAQQRVMWAQRFREHYESVAAKAKIFSRG